MDSIQAESLSGPARDELIQQFKQEIAIASTQELLAKITDKCFKKCVNKPGASLDSSEQKCVAMCMDRYMDAFTVISEAYRNRLQKEHNNSGMSGLW